METEFAKWLATLGVGGAIAAIVYYQARKDAMMYQEKLLVLHELEKGRTDKLIDIIKESTYSTTVNTEVLRSLHKRLDNDALDREVVVHGT
jgi:hypothetical protein